jgi:hypothetical protein
VFLSDVNVEAVRNFVEIIFSDSADETIVLELVLNALHLVSQRAESVNDET